MTMQSTRATSYRGMCLMVLLSLTTVVRCFPVPEIDVTSEVSTSTQAPSAAEAERYVADFLNAELKALLSNHRVPASSAADMESSDNSLHSPVSPFARYRRGVSLGSLRKVANNVALSEYYRIRGLDALSSLSVPDALGGAADGSPDDDATLQKSKIFKRLYDTIRRDKTLGNIFGYLQP